MFSKLHRIYLCLSAFSYLFLSPNMTVNDVINENGYQFIKSLSLNFLQISKLALAYFLGSLSHLKTAFISMPEHEEFQETQKLSLNFLIFLF